MGTTNIAAARAVSPAASAYWEKSVDPEGSMTPAERSAAAAEAKREHFASLGRCAAARRKQQARAAGEQTIVAAVEKAIEDAPPLSPVQRDRLVGLLHQAGS